MILGQNRQNTKHPKQKMLLPTQKPQTKKSVVFHTLMCMPMAWLIGDITTWYHYMFVLPSTGCKTEVPAEYHTLR